MTFEKAVQHILRHEGGYVNDPSDPGGETNFGISARAYPALNIRSLNKAAATEIYRRDYWEKLQIEKLPESLRLIFFDAAVNQGQTAAVKMLQTILDVKVDGVIGPKTLHAAGLCIPILLVKRFAIARYKRYLDTKNFDRFGSGWTQRLVDISILSGSEKA